MERGAAAFPAFLARRCLCPGGGGRSLPSPSWPFLPCSKLRRSLGPQRIPGLRRPRQEPAQACGVLGSGTRAQQQPHPQPPGLSNQTAAKDSRSDTVLICVRLFSRNSSRLLSGHF